MILHFYNPPSSLLSSGSKDGVELGGSKTIVSIDESRNLYSEGTIFTEMSWAEFYKDIEGLEDQINTFTTREYKSVRTDPEALVETISSGIRSIISNKRLFYGILDVEVDCFMNRNTVIPGLKLEPHIIINLMDAHKRTRNKDLFPKIVKDEKKGKNIPLEFHGEKEKRMIFYGSKLEDLANQLRVVDGFATGIVCTSNDAANFYIMNDNIVFKEGEDREFYIDKDNIKIIEMGIQRELLFPLSWFRMDLGIRALNTLELWDDISKLRDLQIVIAEYEHYVLKLIFKKFEQVASSEKIGVNLEEDFFQMTPSERNRALKDMAYAIKLLTKEYKK